MHSRRTLFGLLGGAAVAPFVPVPAPIDAAIPIKPGDLVTFAGRPHSYVISPDWSDFLQAVYERTA